VATTIAPAAPLTASDRCDRCGARAYIRVSLLNGGELLFCVHHGRAHDAALRSVLAEISDQSAVLSGTAESDPTDGR
jgi:hypothetical protein